MLFSRKKKSSMPAHGPQRTMSSEPSFIGRNCIFEGHITCDGELHVDGTIRGTVQSRLCVVDSAGVVQGTVSGEIIHVRGRVLGPIQGSNVFIHAGAHVEGDVFNDTISIENGAFVYGSIRHNSALPPQSASNPLNGSGLKEQPLPAEGTTLDPNPPPKGLRVITNRK
jgi:cytoskeletal protein CcmA (bactofilin family)